MRNLWAALHKSARRLRWCKMCEIIKRTLLAAAAIARRVYNERFVAQAASRKFVIYTSEMKHLRSHYRHKIRNLFALVMSQRARIHCKQ